MGPVQVECQTLFVWRDACGPQLADLFPDTRFQINAEKGLSMNLRHPRETNHDAVLQNDSIIRASLTRRTGIPELRR
jgi:hypothetical protein